MNESERQQRDRIAQWAFDTRPILGRFHMWLEDVEPVWVDGTGEEVPAGRLSFLPAAIERLIALTVAATALGTKLFGRFGEGEGKDKSGLNQVKKDADAISAYAMSEALWYASRLLPENHAIMVCLGEGLMPKGGETPEMGSNPNLGFGRVYARPEVAKWIDQRVKRLINDPDYGWERFYAETKRKGVRIWGAAIDTLECTSRFAKGKETGPLSVLHLFDQPLCITRPYEGYVGNLILPEAVVTAAADNSSLVDYRTPRGQVMDAIRMAYPDVQPGNVHVWTLSGKSRVKRIGKLWAEWRDAGAHLVESGWVLPSGLEAFTDSGTYAPTYRVGDWVDDAGDRHVFVCDGYAASAEAMQAASLAPVLGQSATLAVFTSSFKLSWELERDVMRLDPEDPDFASHIQKLAGPNVSVQEVGEYAEMIRDARDAGMPIGSATITADDFFPEKNWKILAATGHMCPDPYTGAPGIEEVEPGLFHATTMLATRKGRQMIRFKLRMMEDENEAPLVFKPLLVRFFDGEDYQNRAVRISDSGRIRNELQTLCSEALVHDGTDIHVHFDRIPGDVIPPAHQESLLEILAWYQEHHPMWFDWLHVVPRGG
ncbi:MAG: hypothetical protein ACYTGZ_11290 [Planctomycetota bacterium]|jgi:hypothetical protein